MKIKKPKTLNRDGRFKSHTLNEILPYLPEEDCFFDSRHWVCDTLDGILPFALTTKISSNSQQFLKIYEKEEENGIWHDGKFIEVGSSFYLNDCQRFFRGGLKDIARCIKCDGTLAILEYEKESVRTE